MSDRPEDPFDGSLAAENPAEEARGLRGLLGRHAVDTRPLRIPEYRRILIGQGTSFIGSMLTQVAVPVQIWALTASATGGASVSRIDVRARNVTSSSARPWANSERRYAAM